MSYELLVGADGRIAAKHESVASRESYFICEYDESGHLLRAWRDGRLAEEYTYDPRGARVASRNGKDGQWKYGYDAKGRLPQAVTVQTPQGATNYLLDYDQVGSLKAVAAMEGGRSSLRDRFTGLVRFVHRDYDPTVGRFTAPDPLGDTGGDHDLYDYCVDEPVGWVDPHAPFLERFLSRA